MKLRAALVISALVVVLPAAKSPDPNPRYLSPTELAISPDGLHLYVACQGSDELVIVDTRNSSVVGRVATGRVPKGVAVSADGSHVYVGNSWSDTVSDVDARTQTVARTLPTGF